MLSISLGMREEAVQHPFESSVNSYGGQAHKPHSRSKEVKSYVIQEMLETLRKEGLS